MSKASLVYKHYQRALAQWPADILRPEVSFQKSMHKRIDQKFLLPNRGAQARAIAKDGPDNNIAPATLDETAELEQANALYSFLENRYTKKYPLSNRLMKPASNPTYYENLIQELRDAPQRSWIGRMINRWKGFLRFS